ncbi:MAG: arylsulfatase, partial [Verrucomicrobia bacterium]
RHRDEPFFLFFASHDIHVPRMPHERFQGKSALGYRGDAILELDWSVGRLMDALDELGIAENTLVVFCSDNGPVLDDGYKDGAVEKNGDHRPAGGFKGGKYSVYEGGTRTPFIVRWKGHVQPGVSDALVCTIDLGASFASLVGVDVPEDALPDSFDVLDALLGRPGARGRDHLVQQDNGNRGNFGYRSGRWKLTIHPSGRAYNTVVEQKLAWNDVPPEQLFDLESDPGETTDLSARHPEILARLKAELQAIIDRGRSRP